MKKILIAAIACALLSGCTSGIAAATPEQVQSLVASEQAHANLTPEEREKMQQEAAQAATANEERKAGEREQIEDARRACEAVHPLLASDCD